MSELTQEQKREKIAEACGRIWHAEHSVDSEKSGVTAGTPSFHYCIQYCRCGAYKQSSERWWNFDSDKPEFGDPFADLNVMHEAEKVLDPVDSVLQRRSYVEHLCRLVDVDPDMDRWSFIQDFILLHATAAQRAEAFGRTLGLWS